MTLQEIILELKLTAEKVVKNGWGEATAGNISVNITTAYPQSKSSFQSTNKTIPFQKAYPALSGQHLLVSISGSRMSDMAINPKNCLCLMSISPNGKESKVSYFHAENSLPPTSEYPAHLAVQEVFIQNKMNYTTLLHTHCDETITITHHPKYNNEERLNKLLWSMLPEIMMFLPNGIGWVAYQFPGSESLASATADKILLHPALLWEKHGCLTSGASPLKAMDLQELIAKAIRIYLSCCAAGFQPEGLSEKQIQDLFQRYHA